METQKYELKYWLFVLWFFNLFSIHNQNVANLNAIWSQRAIIAFSFNFVNLCVKRISSPSALTMCVYWIKDLGATLSLIEFCLLCVRSCCWTFYIPRKGNWNNLRTFKKAFFVDVKSFTFKKKTFFKNTN
jgi:hypothetical protein